MSQNHHRPPLLDTPPDVFEPPQMALTKLWMRCGDRARREFLRDLIERDERLVREALEARP